MKRIDYIMNSKDPIQTIIDEIGIDCDMCPGQGCDCEERCRYYARRHLEQEIEVNESNLKTINVSVEATDEQIDTKEALQKALDEVRKQLLKTKDKLIDMKEESVENDPVNHPSHYTDTKIEVIDYIEDKGLNFNRGNVIKYVSRAGKKDPSKEIQDLKKGSWYLNREIERLEKQEQEEE